MTDPSTPPRIAEWEALDWESTLAGMEAVLQASREAQKQSLQNRKLLSDTTKQFKRSVKNVEQVASSLSSPDGGATNIPAAVKVIESLSMECRGTVKAYQEEIDKLTRRCKTAEAAYSGLAQSLGDKTDPAALLAQQQTQMNQLLRTVDQVNQEMQVQEKTTTNYKKEIQQLKATVSTGSGMSSGLSKEEREELVSLRKEVTEYEVEFRSLKNQDITIRKLEARIAELQTSGEENMQDQLEKHKQEIEETQGRRVAEALEREASLERKVETLELQLKAERAGREATQTHLLQADEGVSQREAAWEAQRRILVDDSHRVRESLQTATRERDGLRLQVAASEGKKAQAPSSGGFSPADFALERKAYEAEVAELSETASLLREELKTKEDMLADVNRSSGLKIDSLERDTKNLQSKMQMLQADLGAAPTQTLVDSMRRELRILKRLEYNADDVDADLDPEIAGDEKDLESVLVSKLRRAESELVTERIGRSELVKEVDALHDAVTTVKKEKTDADKLIQALERDLEKAIAAAPSQSSTTTTAKEPPAKVQEVGSSTLASVMDPDSTPSGRPPSPTPMSVSLHKSTSEKADDDHSVATIVMAQRDRLRARCEALEAERDSFKRELQGQVQASESLKTDNTKLYEKVRYLQNYNKGPSNRPGLDRDLDLETLEQRYEASVDPFRQFNRTERQRKLNEMSPMERTVFIVAKSVLATKEMRTALFFYVLTLHLLVFSTTTHWSHSEACNSNNNEHLAILPHEQQTAHLRGSALGGGDAP
jgi:homeobox protein cut-like